MRVLRSPTYPVLLGFALTAVKDGRVGAFTTMAHQTLYRPTPSMHMNLDCHGMATMTLDNSNNDTVDEAINNSNLASTTSINRRRQELKHEILRLADEYEKTKNELDRQYSLQQQQQQQEDKERSYVRNLLGRIIQKVLRRKPDNKQRNQRRRRRIIRKDTLGTSKLDTGATGQQIIQLSEELAKLNPTAVPVYGWKGYGKSDNPTADCQLQGNWKLRFTTAADATFSTSPLRGQTQTYQEIDALSGTLTNVVKFEKGKLQGFRVVVAGRAVADTQMDLRFCRVVLLRNSKFPRWFGRIVIPIPARGLRLLNRFLMMKCKTDDDDDSARRGPYFEIQYLDDDFRMHKTGEGNWFIQSRFKDNA